MSRGSKREIKRPSGLHGMFDFDDDGLLCEWQDGKPLYKWTYSTFEDHVGESISPSMYNYMANYVLNNVSSGHYSINLEAEAVESYYSMTDTQRELLREQSLTTLKVRKSVADSKVSAALDALLDDTHPFDETSPIAHEYVVFMRGLVQKYSLEAHKWADLIHEEEIKH
jgi:hypothetical protein